MEHSFISTHLQKSIPRYVSASCNLLLILLFLQTLSSQPSHFSDSWPPSWYFLTPGAPSSRVSSSTSSGSSRGGRAASSSAPIWRSDKTLGSHWSILSTLNTHLSLVSWLLGLSLGLALSPLIPPASSSSVGLMSVSTRTMTYLLGLQLTASRRLPCTGCNSGSLSVVMIMIVTQWTYLAGTDWSDNTLLPGGGTTLHWSQVVTGDCGGHRDLLQVLYWQLPDADIALVTRPLEVSWYHLIILSFVPILKFRGYILTIKCLV